MQQKILGKIQIILGIIYLAAVLTTYIPLLLNPEIILFTSGAVSGPMLISSLIGTIALGAYMIITGFYNLKK